MKNLLLFLVITLFSTSLFAQEITEEEEPSFVYCQIVGMAKFMSKKVTIQIDFGDKMNYFADSRLKDPKTGKLKVFNSMVDALNYMGKRGWEFEQAYALTISNQNVYHYLLKKPFVELDEETQNEFMKPE
jgi:hypothetical protein